MTLGIKNNSKTPLVIPASARRKAGFVDGQELEIRTCGGVISIVPKMPPEDLEDYLELRDPAVQRQIKQSNADIRADRVQPAAELLNQLERRAATRKRRQKT